MPENWTLNDKVFEKYIDGSEIQKRISLLAMRIDRELKGKKPLFVVVLNGAFMFASDLMKRVTIDCEVAFVRLSSYQGMQSTGTVQQVIGLNMDIRGRTVVIVEDIVDTGLTLELFLETLRALEPGEVKVATCLLKPEAFSDKFTVDYSCFSIPNEFVVGYGLDYDGIGRNSSDIYKICDSN